MVVKVTGAGSPSPKVTVPSIVPVMWTFPAASAAIAAPVHRLRDYTYLDLEFRKSPDPAVVGKDLLNVPRHSATLWTTYDFLEKWQIGGGPTYVSARYNNAANDARIPGHVLWDATLAYQLTKNFQLRLNAINLTNDLYYSNISGGHVVPGIGRTFILSTSVKF